MDSELWWHRTHVERRVYHQKVGNKNETAVGYVKQLHSLSNLKESEEVLQMSSGEQHLPVS